jgi:chaperonin GroEL (HSP60 family)
MVFKQYSVYQSEVQIKQMQPINNGLHVLACTDDGNLLIFSGIETKSIKLLKRLNVNKIESISNFVITKRSEPGKNDYDLALNTNEGLVLVKLVCPFGRYNQFQIQLNQEEDIP